MVIKFHRTKDTLDRIYHLIIFAECVRRVAPYPTRTPGIQMITSAISPPPPLLQTRHLCHVKHPEESEMEILSHIKTTTWLVPLSSIPVTTTTGSEGVPK